MKNTNKEAIQQEVFDLYDDYAHNRIDRRSFMDKLSVYAIGGLTVPALLQAVMPDYETKIQVQQNDPRLNSEFVEYDSPNGGGKIKGLLSRPVGNKQALPGIVVVHENRGLNPHIEDVTRRAALAGFIAIGPDALSPLGGYPGNDDAGRELQAKRDREEMLQDFIAAFEYLKSHPECTGKVGVVGFCFGGWVSNMMAVRLPDLMAAVPFYGGQPAAEEVPNIKAPLLLHFAAMDKRVNEGWPAYAAALQDNNKEYSAHLYPDVQHGFHNDSTGRYDYPAAQLAWQRTIDFFGWKLG
ncbi:MAG TPA: dienelactone hydrolase family protein [Saprospiraceae bacterium]|nr:dienelactone hydrolase family protein [Saprospiraceae bacterium]HMQ82364.1 dienelactone hydrolase family protein [Saprospiraceae bacterium]